MGDAGKDVNGELRRQGSDSGHEDAGHRQRDADAECHDSDVRFGIVPVLISVIPPIAHFRDRRAEADGQCREDGTTTQSHAIGSVALVWCLPKPAVW